MVDMFFARDLHFLQELSFVSMRLRRNVFASELFRIQLSKQRGEVGV